MPTLDVVQLNIYARNAKRRAAIKGAVEGRPDSVGINEGHRAARQLARVPGYRVHRAEHGAMQRGYHDTQVLVRNDHESLGELALKVSDLVPSAERVAPDRWVTAAVYEAAVGPVMHVSWHPDASPEKLEHGTPSPVVREYAASVQRVAALLAFARALDLHRVVTADLNVLEGWPDQPYDPYRMLDRAGLRDHRADRWDVVACSSGLSIDSSSAVPVPGGDHKMIRARLRGR